MRLMPAFVVFSLFSVPLLAAELPDPAITPGAIDPEVTADNIQESICKQKPISWSQAHLPPASWLENLEKEQIGQYHYSDTGPKHYTEDHLIPLSLGGHPTDAQNIWPQPLVAKWSARRKDYLEEVITRKVCKGEMPLAEAQDLFRTDWIAAYRKHIGDVSE
ncbi:hypothetical protein FJZ55_04095 [Candidatus Woesearchaeota archaeon]|nr:hypothetical protein [Candidatus Woesearchaeota archaeon]